MTNITKSPLIGGSAVFPIVLLFPVFIVKLWDVNMERRPVEVYPVHDYLRSRLCSLYENDCIFDKFECGFNGDDRSVYLQYNTVVMYMYMTCTV